MVDEPKVSTLSEVAAPLFARIIADALRLHGIKPDGEDTSTITVVEKAHESEVDAS